MFRESSGGTEEAHCPDLAAIAQNELGKKIRGNLGLKYLKKFLFPVLVKEVKQLVLLLLFAVANPVDFF